MPTGCRGNGGTLNEAADAAVNDTDSFPSSRHRIPKASIAGFAFRFLSVFSFFSSAQCGMFEFAHALNAR